MRNGQEKKAVVRFLSMLCAVILRFIYPALKYSIYFEVQRFTTNNHNKINTVKTGKRHKPQETDNCQKEAHRDLWRNADVKKRNVYVPI